MLFHLLEKLFHYLRNIVHKIGKVRTSICLCFSNGKKSLQQYLAIFRKICKAESQKLLDILSSLEEKGERYLVTK